MASPAADAEPAVASAMELDDAAGAAVAAPPQPSLLLDALPYVDTQDAQTQEQVQQLLQDEMAASTRTPDEYLADFLRVRGYNDRFQSFESPMLAAGFAALSAGRPAVGPLDMSRYKLAAPSENDGSAASLSAWRAAVDSASAALEHQNTRHANLELLKKYGAAAWREHNEQLTAVRTTLSTALASARADSESLNRKRKAAQVALGADLALLDSGFHALVEKNHSIEAACLQLQQQLEQQSKKKSTPAQ